MKEVSPKMQTEFELRFLRDLGRVSKDVHRDLAREVALHKTDFDRRTLLANYIKSAELRVDWMEIDRERVLSYARAELEACR